MTDTPSPWVVVLKRDEPADPYPWGRAVVAGATWHVGDEAQMERGLPNAAPRLLVVRSPSRGELDIAVPPWLDRARVWCHFGNNNSDHPDLYGPRIQRELWSATRARLFRGEVPELLVNPFSSSDRRLPWDHRLAELGRAVSLAITTHQPLTFDLSSLEVPWSAATRRYYRDLVHLRMLEVIRPLYLRPTTTQVVPVAKEGLREALDAKGLAGSTFVQDLLSRIPEDQLADLEALFSAPGDVQDSQNAT